MKRNVLIKSSLFALALALLAGCTGGTSSPAGNSSTGGSTSTGGTQNSTSSSTGTPASSSTGGNQSSVKDYDGTEVQGVTEDKIYIGNTAATTGAFATVGVPFNLGLNAALKEYNDAGGFNGKTVELLHYDDEFDGAKGLTYTKKLVEEDEVFALVGHFGTNTVGATVDYIVDKGVPMVYAATGISQLYNENAQGHERAVMSVQPIYNAEGRVLLARAVASTDDGMGLGGTKIGVIYTTDDAGQGMLEGIKRQAQELNVNIKYVPTEADAEDHSSAVNSLMVNGCDVVVVAANQAPFKKIVSAMADLDYEDVKVITSYVSADAAEIASIGEDAVNEYREVYTTAWLDITDNTYFYNPSSTDNPVGYYLLACYQAFDDTLGYPNLYDYGVFGFNTDYWKAAEAIAAYDISINGWTSATAWTNSFNSYALAGYIAGSMFVQGLDRVAEAEEDLTWLNYIEAMESSPVDVLMGGEIDYSNGQRLGITDLAVNKYNHETAQLNSYSGLKSLSAVMDAVPANLKK